MPNKKPRAPAGLGVPGRRFWGRITGAYGVPDPALDVLEQACRALDRAEECRAVIEAEGLVVLDRFDQSRAHPLLAAERDARSQFRMLFRELGLEEPEPPKPLGRRPGGKGLL